MLSLYVRITSESILFLFLERSARYNKGILATYIRVTLFISY